MKEPSSAVDADTRRIPFKARHGLLGGAKAAGQVPLSQLSALRKPQGVAPSGAATELENHAYVVTGVSAIYAVYGVFCVTPVLML